MNVLTESGSVYEFNMKSRMVRRVNENSSLRADNDWVKFFFEPEIVVGYPMTLMLSSLGEGSFTMRVTSRVVSVE